MSSGTSLRGADLRFLNLIAAHREGRPCDPPDEAALAALIKVLDARASAHPGADQPFQRAAELAATLLADRVFSVAPRATALLALGCQLRLEGYQVSAPQGVLAGMIEGLERGTVGAGAVVRWLEDRTLKLEPNP